MTDFNLTGFAAFLGTVAAEMHHHEAKALEAAAVIVETEAKAVIGTYRYGWPPLAESTLKKKGADTPLLETGAMRDSIQHIVLGHHEAHVGSDDQNAVYQELGTKTIPPRSFLMGAAMHKEHEVVEVIGRTVSARLLSGT